MPAYRGVNFDAFTHNAASAKAVKAAVTGYRVILLGLYLTAASAVNATVEDTDGTNLTEILQFTANNLHLNMLYTGNPWAVSNDSTGLQILLDDTVVTSGIVIWELETIDP